MTRSFRHQVLEVVRAIPSGKVCSYGDVATLAGSPRAARAVGSILRHTPWSAEHVPWHRVINQRGEISTGGDVLRPQLQRELLISEGIVFAASDRIDMRVYRWDIRDAPSFADVGAAPWDPPRDWVDVDD